MAEVGGMADMAGTEPVGCMALGGTQDNFTGMEGEDTGEAGIMNFMDTGIFLAE